MRSQAATEAAEGGDGRSSREEGGAEGVVAMRPRGEGGAATPVTAGSHSRVCEVAVQRCVELWCGVDEGGLRACFVVSGCATPIKIGGVSGRSLGCSARMVGRAKACALVCLCLGGRLCHHAVNCLVDVDVHEQSLADECEAVVVVCGAGDAHAQEEDGGRGVGGGGGGGRLKVLAHGLWIVGRGGGQAGVLVSEMRSLQR